MTTPATIELQRLMNDVTAQQGAGKIVQINGRAVRCIGVAQSRKPGYSFRFDLDGKRAPFAKVCSALGVTA